MRNLALIALALLISLPAVALQGPPAQGGRGGAAGAGGPGGPGAGGGRGARGGGDAAQPAPPEDPGFECFEKVDTPDFPATALQRRIDGTAWVRVDLTPQGTISNLDLKVISAWGTAPALLGPPVDKVVRAAKFKATC